MYPCDWTTPYGVTHRGWLDGSHGCVWVEGETCTIAEFNAAIAAIVAEFSDGQD